MERQVTTLQHGIWIDQQRLAAAGLEGPLVIAVQSGEIRIRSASAEAVRTQSSQEPLLDVAGSLSGPPVSTADIERDLYSSRALES